MRINITAGECLKEILEAKYPGERFVPFNEAMIYGTYSEPLFSEGFIKERSAANGINETDYRNNMAGFIEVLEHIDEYGEIVLWFGDEPFCVENRRTVLEALVERDYCGIVIMNTVNELTGGIIVQESIRMGAHASC